MLTEFLEMSKGTAIRSTDDAARVMSLLAADNNGMITFPVDPADIAKKLEIEVQYGALPLNVAGAISKEAGAPGANVVINEADSRTRQRFTLAHEIGHYIKHAREDGPTAATGFVDFRNEMSGAGIDSEEVFANGFAAEILTPAFAVRHYWSQGKDLAEMLRIFDISRQSMEIRLSSLGLV